MIRSNLNFEKYIQAGLDIGTNKICCAISEIDVKTDTVRLWQKYEIRPETSLKTVRHAFRGHLSEQITDAPGNPTKQSSAS